MNECTTSKSQKKREMHQLQRLGERLMDLKIETLKDFQLNEALFSAISEAKRLKSREALRRQKQYIGKLMKGVDLEPILEKFQAIELEQTVSTRTFKDLEAMRAALIADGNEAINKTIERIPQVDRQKLRQLTKRSRAEVKDNLPPQAQRALFKFLREALQAQTCAQDETTATPSS